MDCEQLQQAYQQAQAQLNSTSAMLMAAQTARDAAIDAVSAAQLMYDTAQLMVTNYAGMAEQMNCDWYTGGGGA